MGNSFDERLSRRGQAAPRALEEEHSAGSAALPRCSHTMVEGARFQQRGFPARNAQHFQRLDHASDAERGVLDRLDLEHVPAAGNEIADLPRGLFARKVADRLAVVADELVAKDTCHGPLHRTHPTALFG